jgi:E3 ubiquitin-protein ligase UBR7
MMICYNCQDWFHDRCLPGITDDAEGLICKDCVIKLPFLRAYAVKEFNFVDYVKGAQEVKKNVDKNEIAVAVAEKDTFVNQKNKVEGQEPTPKKQKLEDQEEIDVQELDICPLSTLALPSTSPLPAANIFLSIGWRTKFCRCNECMRFYDSEKIEYLLGEDVEECEFDDARSVTSLEEAGMDEFNRLPREQAIQVGAWRD